MEHYGVELDGECLKKAAIQDVLGSKLVELGILSAEETRPGSVGFFFSNTKLVL